MPSTNINNEKSNGKWMQHETPCTVTAYCEREAHELCVSECRCGAMYRHEVSTYLVPGSRLSRHSRNILVQHLIWQLGPIVILMTNFDPETIKSQQIRRLKSGPHASGKACKGCKPPSRLSLLDDFLRIPNHSCHSRSSPSILQSPIVHCRYQ